MLSYPGNNIPKNRQFKITRLFRRQDKLMDTKILHKFQNLPERYFHERHQQKHLQRELRLPLRKKQGKSIGKDKVSGKKTQGQTQLYRSLRIEIICKLYLVDSSIEEQYKNI